VDQTRLKGAYDFTLRYTYDEERAPKDGSAPPSLFTAIQEQLGLKLEPVKAPARCARGGCGGEAWGELGWILGDIHG
jgi:uncharacterized protein (TIGR03435 family)